MLHCCGMNLNTFVFCCSVSYAKICGRESEIKRKMICLMGNFKELAVLAVTTAFADF